MNNDIKSPDNKPDNDGQGSHQPFEERPYYEFAPQRPPARPANIPGTPPAGPWPGPPAQFSQPGQQWQKAPYPSPWGQPPGQYPTLWPPQMTPPPQPPTGMRSSLTVWWYILGFVCVLALVFGGTYVLVEQALTHSGNQTSAQSQKTGSTSAPVTGTFQSAGCPFQPGSGITEGQQLRCGFLSVPEDRSNKHSQSIKLAVAIFTP